MYWYNLELLTNKITKKYEKKLLWSKTPDLRDPDEDFFFSIESKFVWMRFRPGLSTDSSQVVEPPLYIVIVLRVLWVRTTEFDSVWARDQLQSQLNIIFTYTYKGKAGQTTVQYSAQ